MLSSLVGYILINRDGKTIKKQFPMDISCISREIIYDAVKDKKGMLNEDEILEVFIPDDVHVICDNAFRDFKNLRSVHLNSGGSSLHYIGQYAFCGCSSLYIFDKSNELRYVGKGSFLGTKVPCFNMIDKDLKVDFISENAFEKENGVRVNTCMDDISSIINSNIGGVVDYA